jgi:multidrug efflux pump subunit AcrA (membrane-fusion protein)
MHCTIGPEISDRSAGSRWLLCLLLAALTAPGCGHEPVIEFTHESPPAAVHVLSPPVRDLVRVVGQPSFIEAYERTSIFPKPTAYLEKWIADIGDKVKKGQVLATLFVPELVEDHGTKMATVEFDQERIDLAKEAVEVARADVKAAQARLVEAQAILEKYQAEVDRWDVEVKRLKSEVPQGTIDSRVLFESTNQLKSSMAARDQAKAAIKRAEAELRLQRATLAKAEVAVKVAEADLKVAQSEERRLKAWLGYLTLTAPFDGVIVSRNANTFDFVLPTTGDPTASRLGERATNLSPGGAAAPIYVVDRTDTVRIFIDIPEQDANYVNVGTRATVLVKAYRDQPIAASVTRISWALNAKSRTLRAEIDLRNPESKLLPSMYAYVNVMIERHGVRALPLDALTYSGDQAYFWNYENGHAVRTEIETGVSDGEWIEITNRRDPEPPTATGEVTWVPIDGSERVILGDVSTLTDGAPVRIVAETGASKVARADSRLGR